MQKCQTGAQTLSGANPTASTSYHNRATRWASVRDSESSSSLYCRVSDIRTPTAMNYSSFAEGRYASMEPDIFISPSQPEGCAECSTECQDASCRVAEMTSQCTDQCVVVACNDPTHREMSCHGAQTCDDTCNEGADDCNGFEEFVRDTASAICLQDANRCGQLQCCTDYHAYFSDVRSLTPQRVDSVWNPSLDAIFCDCGELRSDNTMYPNSPAMRSDLFGLTTPEMLSSRSSIASASPTLPSTPIASHPNSIVTIPNTFNLPSLAVAMQPSIVTCMWGNCGASFASLSDLVGHVNLQHLRLPSPAPPTHSPEIRQHHPNTSNTSIEALSCLWGDCNVYSSPDCIPGPSTGNQTDAALNILASHLFQDHLGLPNEISFADPQLPTYFDTTANTGILAPPETAPTPSSDSAGPVVHECSGSHSCNWQSCSQTFTSCDELTAHITAVHVGAGKAHYECFWDGCKRHGDQGFSSKQKICRHIQVGHPSHPLQSNASIVFRLQSHTGHRPFQCKVCKQNFSEAATLQQHMRRHTLESR
jgi:hypothetical protein